MVPVLCAVLMLLAHARADALQPTFIRGSVFNAHTKTLVSNATVATSTGVRTTTTGGAYNLRVPPSMYILIVSAPGYQSNILTDIWAAPGQVAQVDFHLIPASTPTGIVEGRVMQGLLRSPVGGALVSSDLGGVAVTDPGGYFTMVSPSGTARITAAAEGSATRVLDNVRIDPNHTNRLLLLLGPGSQDTITVSGTVTDTCTGFKIDGARIYSTSLATSLNTDGFFVIDNQAGPTTLLATARNYQFSLLTRRFTAVPRNQIAGLALQPTTGGFIKITGTVTDALSGLPLDGVRLESDQGTTSFTIAGAYTLYTNSCSVFFSASREGYQDHRVSISADTGQSARVNFSLAPLSGISGRIFDSSSNSPITGARVTLLENPGSSMLTDHNGRFGLSNLQPGIYTIEARHACFEIELCRAETAAGETAHCLMPADRYDEAILLGSVRDAVTDAPLDGARIVTDYGAHTETGANGAFQAVLPACNQTVSISADGYLEQVVQDIMLTPGATYPLHIQLMPCPVLNILYNSTPEHAECSAELLRHLRDRSARHTGSDTLIRLFYAASPWLVRAVETNPDIGRRLTGLALRAAEYLCGGRAPHHEHATDAVFSTRDSHLRAP